MRCAAPQAGSITSRTTNFQRTIATLRGVLTGLYPGTRQPIPVQTSSVLDEILFADSKSCPHLETFMKHAKMLLTSEVPLLLGLVQLWLLLD